jgi:hypothetical protein
MRKLLLTATAVAALALAGTAAAALEPFTFDPGNACPGVSATFSGGVLHLAKPCTTATNASAGAEITGANGQTFTSASFTLASAAQCQGGSPRFNVFTTTGTFFLGCNNVTPTTNADGTVTYTFNAATLAAAGQQVPTPTGTITGVELLIDVQGTADVSAITFNGVAQAPLVGPPTSKDQCKHNGWRSFTNPTFKNQGQCVAFVVHHTQHGRSHEHHAREHHAREHHAREHQDRTHEQHAGSHKR